VVRETVVAGAVAAAGIAAAGDVVALAGAAVCVCAHASTAAAKIIMARDRFFTAVLDPGGEFTDS
jgi:hypothetical protein